MVSYSAIILAGGASKRFSEDKGLFLVDETPLSYFVIQSVKPIISDIVIVVKTSDQVKEYQKIFSDDSIRIVADNSNIFAPIVGIFAGLIEVNSDYSLVLPVDSPLITTEFVHFLISFAPTHSAVIPRWPSGYIEPLHAVYHTESTKEIVKDLIQANEYRVHKIIDELRNVLYVSTEVFKNVDPNLESFLNINNQSELLQIIKKLKKRIL